MERAMSGRRAALDGLARILDAGAPEELFAGPEDEAHFLYGLLVDAARARASAHYWEICRTARRRSVTPDYVVDRAAVLLATIEERRRTDLYRILGVPPLSSGETIREHWLELAKRHHPDVGGDGARFRQAQQAYEILRDPARRAEYERFWLRALGPFERVAPRVRWSRARRTRPRRRPRRRRRRRPSWSRPAWARYWRASRPCSHPCARTTSSACAPSWRARPPSSSARATSSIRWRASSTPSRHRGREREGRRLVRRRLVARERRLPGRRRGEQGGHVERRERRRGHAREAAPALDEEGPRPAPVPVHQMMIGDRDLDHALERLPLRARRRHPHRLEHLVHLEEEPLVPERGGDPAGAHDVGPGGAAPERGGSA